MGYRGSHRKPRVLSGTLVGILTAVSVTILVVSGLMIQRTQPPSHIDTADILAHTRILTDIDDSPKTAVQYATPAPKPVVTPALKLRPVVKHRHLHKSRPVAVPAPVQAAPAPVQAAPQAPTSGVLSPAQVGALWIEAGGPAWAEGAAEAVASCESGDNTAAYNPSGATGLWQILGQVVGGSLYDGLVNARNAVAKFEASGDTWAQWVCQP